MNRPMKAMPVLFAVAALTVSMFAGVGAQQPPAGTQQPPPAGQQPPASGQQPPAKEQQPAAPAGQQPRGQGGAPAALPKPLEPVAASTLVAHPDPYYGAHVTVTAAVEQVMSKTAFSVAQTTAKNQEVLVLTPPLQGTLEPNSYVTVIGQVIKLDADKLKELKLEVPADLMSKYNGKPVVVATGVINSAFVDLTKRMPPPMSAEEEGFSKIMKKVGPAFAAVRSSAEGSKADVASENAATLKQAFTETEAFWKSHGKPDAAQWAQGARKQAESIEKAAAAGKWDDVKTSTAALGQACQTCHTTYRERFDDGSFRMKGVAIKSGS